MRINLMLLVALCWLSTMPVRVQGEQPQVRDIVPLIEKIEHETDSNTRTDLASELAKLVSQVRTSDQIDDKVIDDIATLLSDRDDSVRLWVALALGQLGPRANRAVPALERALQEAEAEDQANIKGPSLSSADGIRAALEKIRVAPAQ